MGGWTNPSPLKLIFAISRPYPIHNFLPGHPPVWLRYRRNEDGTDGGFDTAVERWTKTRRGHSFLVDLLKKEYRTKLPWMSGWRKWEERELKACPKLDPGIKKSIFHDYLCPRCKKEKKTKKEERIEKMIVLERERRQQENLQQKKKEDRQRKIARKRAQEQPKEEPAVVHRGLLGGTFWQIGKLVRVLGSVFYNRAPSTSGYQKDSYSRELLRTAHEIEVLSDAYR